jgi:hypothetical protein
MAAKKLQAIAEKGADGTYDVYIDPKENAGFGLPGQGQQGKRLQKNFIRPFSIVPRQNNAGAFIHSIPRPPLIRFVPYKWPKFIHFCGVAEGYIQPFQLIGFPPVKEVGVEVRRCFLARPSPCFC